MRLDDIREDPVLAAISALPAYDVGDIRADRLRRRCRAALAAQHARERAAPRSRRSLWRRAVGPALVGAWCVLYVVETIRFAVVICGT